MTNTRTIHIEILATLLAVLYGFLDKIKLVVSFASRTTLLA